MAELQQICEELVESAEGAIGCAVIDFEAARPLAAAYGSDAGLQADGIDLISGAVSEMFDGKLIRQFQRAWSDTRNAGEFVREVQITTANSHCFISAVPGRDDHALVLVTDKTVSLGLGWMSVHQALAGVADAPPPAAAQERSPATDRAATAGAATSAAPERAPTPETPPSPARTGARARMAAPAAPAAPAAARQPAPQEEPRPPKPESRTPPPEQPPTEPDRSTQAAEPEEQPAQPEIVPERGRPRTYRGVPVRKRGAAKGDDASTPRWSARYRGFSDGGGRSRPPRSDS